MPSVTEQAGATKARSSRFAGTFEIWNRKLHYYLGLYFLFFLWLFPFTRLLMKPSSWTLR